jgi:hypothetical protein
MGVLLYLTQDMKLRKRLECYSDIITAVWTTASAENVLQTSTNQVILFNQILVFFTKLRTKKSRLSSVFTPCCVLWQVFSQ